MTKTKHITVQELFQRLDGIVTLQTVLSIWNATDGNQDVVTKELKVLLAPHTVELEKRGFVADYLAYLLP